MPSPDAIVKWSSVCLRASEGQQGGERSRCGSISSSVSSPVAQGPDPVRMVFESPRAVSAHHREHESWCSVNTLECVVTDGRLPWFFVAQADGWETVGNWSSDRLSVRGIEFPLRTVRRSRLSREALRHASHSRGQVHGDLSAASASRHAHRLGRSVSAMAGRALRPARCWPG